MNSLHVLLPAAAYLIGSIPFGLLLSRGSGIDIRQHGSGNIGATNVSRLVGKKIGLLTLLLDAAKGWLPVIAAGLLLGNDPSRNLTAALCGAAAVTGHMFSVFLRGKGGKGVATALGVFLALAPNVLLIISLPIFILTVAATGFVSLGSILAAAAMLPGLYFLDEPSWKFWLAAYIILMIWLKHHQNIRRLLNGTEKRFRDKEPITQKTA